MQIIYCDNGFNPNEIEDMYMAEYQAAQQVGFSTSLISFEELQMENLRGALKRIRPSSEMTPAIYRGWMLTPVQYSLLYRGLLARKIQLLNSPEQYMFCHYLPQNYALIKAHTPLTTFKALQGVFQLEDFTEQLAPFADKAIIVKDFVKSQKHYWKEACYIPDASDKAHVKAVVEKFLELQGSSLNEGLVFREFVELEALAEHSKSGMPLTKEFRLFIKQGKIVAVSNYWEEGDYAGEKPDLAHFQKIIAAIPSNFFTMDIAKQKDGRWIIVELGDGQVAGLPEDLDELSFYQQLWELRS